MTPNYLDLYGIDPKLLSQLAFSRGLLGLGAGIAGGRNWGESVAKGLAGFGAGQQQAMDEAGRLSTIGMQSRLLKQQEAEAAEKAAQKAAREDLASRVRGAFDVKRPSPFELTPELIDLAIRADEPQWLGQLRELSKPPERPFSGAMQDETGDWVYDPDYLRGQEQIRRAGRSTTSVTNVMPQQETEAAKAIGKAMGEQFVGIQQAGQNAPVAIARHQRLGALLSQINTGAFKGTTNDVKKAAKAAGFDLDAWGISDDTGLVDAAQALSREMALQLRNPAGGAGMPGAMSDKDREFLESMIAGIETSPEAVPLLVDTAVRLEQRNQELARIAREYKAAHNGSIDEGVYDEFAKYSAANPLFTDADAARIGQMGRTTGAQPAPQQGIPTFSSPSDSRLKALPSGAQFYDENGVLRFKP